MSTSNNNVFVTIEERNTTNRRCMHSQVKIVSSQNSNIGLLHRSQQCDYCYGLSLDLLENVALTKGFIKFHNPDYVSSASFHAGISVVCLPIIIVTSHLSRSLTLISMLDYVVVIYRQIGGRGSMLLTMS